MGKHKSDMSILCNLCVLKNINMAMKKISKAFLEWQKYLKKGHINLLHLLLYLVLCLLSFKCLLTFLVHVL